jgi:hypothetical protein
VNEHITPLVLRDEPIAFFRVKPFHCTVCQGNILLTWGFLTSVARHAGGA